jgi:hypothetical protein
MIPTDYREFPERKAEFLCRAARIRETKQPAELVDFTDEQQSLDRIAGLCEFRKMFAEPATIAEAECALFGNVYQPSDSELHLDWLDEQQTRGMGPYRKASTEYDDGLPF